MKPTILLIYTIQIVNQNVITNKSNAILDFKIDILIIPSALSDPIFTH